ncbi:MAG: hypothetical protein JWM33_1471, partial [Caulobacteraceae bacterium]|nr:hypothetical protein [Caulobacteraceae bacterium]
MPCRTSLFALFALTGAVLAPGQLLAASDPLAICRDLSSQAAKTGVRTDPLGADVALKGIRLATESERAPAGLTKDMIDPSGHYTIHYQQLKGAPVWRAVEIEGTLICQEEHFFLADGRGRFQKIESPPASGELCWSSSRSLGTVLGQPALVEKTMVEEPYLGEEILVRPWIGGAWQAGCKLSLRYNDRFEVSEDFHPGQDLPPGAKTIAVKLAESFLRGGDQAGIEAKWAPTDAMIASNLPAFLSQPVEFPTFGGRPRTPFSTFQGEPGIW